MVTFSAAAPAFHCLKLVQLAAHISPGLGHPNGVLLQRLPTNALVSGRGCGSGCGSLAGSLFLPSDVTNLHKFYYKCSIYSPSTDLTPLSQHTRLYFTSLDPSLEYLWPSWMCDLARTSYTKPGLKRLD